MVEQKGPTGAAVLCIIGGVLILAYGALIVGLGASGMASTLNITQPGVTPGFISAALEALGVWGIICGIVVIVMGLLVYTRPRHHVAWGLLAILFSILSIFGGGGLIIGLIIGIIGGIWAAVWKLPVETEPVAPGSGS